MQQVIHLFFRFVITLFPPPKPPPPLALPFRPPFHLFSLFTFQRTIMYCKHVIYAGSLVAPLELAVFLRCNAQYMNLNLNLRCLLRY
jgi:hypothetical protein